MVITFVGMPGCGKSCMGRAIAGKLKMKLIDSDKLIDGACTGMVEALDDTYSSYMTKDEFEEWLNENS